MLALGPRLALMTTATAATTPAATTAAEIAFAPGLTAAVAVRAFRRLAFWARSTIVTAETLVATTAAATMAATAAAAMPVPVSVTAAFATLLAFGRRGGFFGLAAEKPLQPTEKAGRLGGCRLSRAILIGL